MTFSFSIPTPTETMSFEVDPGTSLLFVGANGSGKTRLAVTIEEQLGDRAHRISAHRALTLNPSVPKASERNALLGLRTGVSADYATVNHRLGGRWGQVPAVALLNDYDFLIQSLFAEQANVAVKYYNEIRYGGDSELRSTKLHILTEIWARVLPHKCLKITADDVVVSSSKQSPPYRAFEMSDGERAIFYLIGQTLSAQENSLIIFDEPELHVHRAIMSRLWDELEAARPDCALVLISHDLDFISSRGGQKYVLSDYSPEHGWIIEKVPEDTGFSEELTTLILGSRRPILFVEGTNSSLDKAIYRGCYPDWTVIPCGSCAEVIHSVVTMRANATLTRVTCSGIVDADDYSEQERDLLRSKGIEILPVSEIENIFLLPAVARSIAEGEGFDGEELEKKLNCMYAELFERVDNPSLLEPVVMRYCRRRIDRVLKKLDLGNTRNVEEIKQLYSDQTTSLDIESIATAYRNRIADAVSNKNVELTLKWYDNKGLLSIASKLRGTNKSLFEQWIIRTIWNNKTPALRSAVKTILPVIRAA